MKKYDQRCLACDWRAEIYAYPGQNPPCPLCDGETERIYLSGYGFIGDEIPGGLTVDNLGPTPVTVYSKSELRHEAEKRGLVSRVQHVGSRGSDKSPHTTKWS